jgi:hypothetical protein
MIPPPGSHPRRSQARTARSCAFFHDRSQSQEDSMKAHSLRDSAAPSFGGVLVKDIRFASDREVAAGTEIRLSDAGRPGMVRVRIRLPGTVALIELGLAPIIDGVVVIPDDRVFAITSG